MPIKPENRARYPANWPAISLERRKAAGWRCETPGCGAINGEEHPITGSRVVLTVAHLDHDPSNCAPSNLRVWCQKHHLAYDAEHHRVNAAATRRRRMQTLDLLEEAAGIADSGRALAHKPAGIEDNGDAPP